MSSQDLWNLTRSTIPNRKSVRKSRITAILILCSCNPWKTIPEIHLKASASDWLYRIDFLMRITFLSRYKGTWVVHGMWRVSKISVACREAAGWKVSQRSGFCTSFAAVIGILARTMLCRSRSVMSLSERSRKIGMLNIRSLWTLFIM